MRKHLNVRTIIAFGLIFAFLVNTFGPLPAAQAQEFRLPAPGVMVSLSPKFNPPILKGLKVHPENPFRFEFILDQGDSVGGQTETTKLIKYFLASLTIPEKDLWVNLSPYEKNRIVPESFGQTEMGRDLLAEDYMLKQITASLIYPEGETGKKFWKRVYQEAAQKFGTTNFPVNTFNKVWIVPEKAVVYENAKAGTAYVVESKLKVMLEQDYLALDKNQSQPPRRGGEAGCQASEALNVKATQSNAVNALGSSIVREIVIPELTKEVNEGKNFAQLRQVYNSLILATWYKKKIKDSILDQVYADKNKIKGLSSPNVLVGDPAEGDVEAIYLRYLQAFKKGVYNYIKEDQDPMTQQSIPRKYFSGGVDETSLSMKVLQTTTHIDAAQLLQPSLSVVMAQLKNTSDKDFAQKLNQADQAMAADDVREMQQALTEIKHVYNSSFSPSLQTFRTYKVQEDPRQISISGETVAKGNIIYMWKSQPKSSLPVYYYNPRFDRTSTYPLLFVEELAADLKAQGFNARPVLQMDKFITGLNDDQHITGIGLSIDTSSNFALHDSIHGWIEKKIIELQKQGQLDEAMLVNSEHGAVNISIEKQHEKLADRIGNVVNYVLENNKMPDGVSWSGRSIIIPLSPEEQFMVNGKTFKAIRLKGATYQGQAPKMQLYKAEKDNSTTQPTYSLEVEKMDGRETIIYPEHTSSPQGTLYLHLAQDEYTKAKAVFEAGIPTAMPIGLGEFTTMDYDGQKVGFAILAEENNPVPLRLGETLYKQLRQHRTQTYYGDLGNGVLGAARLLRSFNDKGFIHSNPHLAQFDAGSQRIYDLNDMYDLQDSNMSRDEFIYRAMIQFLDFYTSVDGFTRLNNMKWESALRIQPVRRVYQEILEGYFFPEELENIRQTNAEDMNPLQLQSIINTVLSTDRTRGQVLPEIIKEITNKNAVMEELVKVVGGIYDLKQQSIKGRTDHAMALMNAGNAMNAEEREKLKVLLPDILLTDFEMIVRHEGSSVDEFLLSRINTFKKDGYSKEEASILLNTLPLNIKQREYVNNWIDNIFHSPLGLPESIKGEKKSLKGKNILVVEDNDRTAETVLGLLEDAGANVEVAKNAQDAMDLLRVGSFHLVLTDFHLRFDDGLELTKEIKGYDPDMPVLIWSEIHPDLQQEAEAEKLGVNFVLKSNSIIEIIEETLDLAMTVSPSSFIKDLLRKYYEFYPPKKGIDLWEYLKAPYHAQGVFIRSMDGEMNSFISIYIDKLIEEIEQELPMDVNGQDAKLYLDLRRQKVYKAPLEISSEIYYRLISIIDAMTAPAPAGSIALFQSFQLARFIKLIRADKELREILEKIYKNRLNNYFLFLGTEESSQLARQQKDRAMSVGYSLEEANSFFEMMMKKPEITLSTGYMLGILRINIKNKRVLTLFSNKDLDRDGGHEALFKSASKRGFKDSKTYREWIRMRWHWDEKGNLDAITLLPPNLNDSSTQNSVIMQDFLGLNGQDENQYIRDIHDEFILLGRYLEKAALETGVVPSQVKVTILIPDNYRAKLKLFGAVNIKTLAALSKYTEMQQRAKGDSAQLNMQQALEEIKRTFNHVVLPSSQALFWPYGDYGDKNHLQIIDEPRNRENIIYMWSQGSALPAYYYNPNLDKTQNPPLAFIEEMAVGLLAQGFPVRPMIHLVYFNIGLNVNLPIKGIGLLYDKSVNITKLRGAIQDWLDYKTKLLAQKPGDSAMGSAVNSKPVISHIVSFVEEKFNLSTTEKSYLTYCLNGRIDVKKAVSEINESLGIEFERKITVTSILLTAWIMSKFDLPDDRFGEVFNFVKTMVLKNVDFEIIRNSLRVAYELKVQDRIKEKDVLFLAEYLMGEFSFDRVLAETSIYNRAVIWGVIPVSIMLVAARIAVDFNLSQSGRNILEDYLFDRETAEVAETRLSKLKEGLSNGVSALSIIELARDTMNEYVLGWRVENNADVKHVLRIFEGFYKYITGDASYDLKTARNIKILRQKLEVHITQKKPNELISVYYGSKEIISGQMNLIDHRVGKSWWVIDISKYGVYINRNTVELKTPDGLFMISEEGDWDNNMPPAYKVYLHAWTMQDRAMIGKIEDSRQLAQQSADRAMNPEERERFKEQLPDILYADFETISGHNERKVDEFLLSWMKKLKEIGYLRDKVAVLLNTLPLSNMQKENIKSWIGSVFHSPLGHPKSIKSDKKSFKGKNILIVEDDVKTAEAVQGLLGDAGANVEVAQNAEEAMDLLAVGSFHLVLTDFHLPYSNGLKLTEQVKKYDPDMPVVIWSEAHPTSQEEAAAGKLGVKFVLKSTGIIEIIEGALDRAMASALQLAEAAKDFLKNNGHTNVMVKAQVQGEAKFLRPLKRGEKGVLMLTGTSSARDIVIAVSGLGDFLKLNAVQTMELQDRLINILHAPPTGDRAMNATQNTHSVSLNGLIKMFTRITYSPKGHSIIYKRPINRKGEIWINVKGGTWKPLFLYGRFDSLYENAKDAQKWKGTINLEIVETNNYAGFKLTNDGEIDFKKLKGVAAEYARNGHLWMTKFGLVIENENKYSVVIDDKEIKEAIRGSDRKLSEEYVIGMKNEDLLGIYGLSSKTWEVRNSGEVSGGGGQGLKKVKSFVENAGGTLTIESGQGKTHVTVLFPKSAVAAMVNGGIDLTPANLHLQTKINGDSPLFNNDKGTVPIYFHIDPAMLQELQNAPGFVPVIISVRPMTDLRAFLMDS